MRQARTLTITVFSVFVFLNGNRLSSQELPGILSGTVLNRASGEPLSSATIRVIGSSQGTSTNTEGEYRISLKPGQYRLAVSYIGFLTDTVPVQILGLVQSRNISLQPSVVPMPEVSVYGDELNPAEEIIAKAIQKKKKFLSQLQSYNFKAYTKTILRVEKKNEATRDTIIGGVLETQTEGFCRGPDQYKEIITARRQTTNFNSNQNIFTVGKMPNFNDDEVVIESQSIVGPTSPKAFDYYSFSMLDTLSIDNLPVYRIRMKPKSAVAPLFDGIISIAEKTYLVMSVDVKGNEALDLAPVKNLHVYQQFALYENKFWLPILSVTTLSVHFAPLPIPAIFIEQTSQIYDYSINTEFPEGTFDRFVLTTLPTADRHDSVFWTSVNRLPLTHEESAAYNRIDSLVSHPNIAARSIMFLAQLPIHWSELPFTEGSDFYHFNRVEGSYVGVGVHLPPVLTVYPTVRAGYGLSDQRAKYDLSLEHRFSRDGTTSIGVGIHEKVQFREEYGYSTSSVTLLALFEKNDPVDYFRSNGWRAFGQTMIFPSVNCRITYLDERQWSVSQTSNFSILYEGLPFRPNPDILEGRLRSISANLSYDTRQWIDVGMFTLADNSRESSELSFAVEHSNPSLLTSDFRFTRLSFVGKQHQLVSRFMALDVYFRGGYAFGALPPQRLFDVISGSSGFNVDGILRTVEDKEFSGDRLAILQFDYNFGSLPFRILGIPYLNNTDVLLYFGSMYTDISASSNAIQTRPIVRAAKLFHEAGFGIGRLLTFFRLDFTWRLTNRTRDNFQLTLGSELF